MKKILIFLAIAVFSLNLAVAQTNYKGKVKVKDDHIILPMSLTKLGKLHDGEEVVFKVSDDKIEIIKK